MSGANKTVTPELVALIVDLLPTAGSLRDIGAITGLSFDQIRRESAPFLAIMKLAGTHPQCGCGKDRFHPYGCVDSQVKGARTVAERAPTAAERKWSDRREAFVEMLVAGHRFVDIDKALGALKASRKFLRFLSKDQIAQREREYARLAQCRNAKKEKEKPKLKPKPKQTIKKEKKPKCAPRRSEPKRPFSDGLYARIASAVPRWLSPALRDDVISDMYVAVTSGAMAVDLVETNARKFASAAANQFETKYGPRSLDEKLFDEGGMTLGDTLVDQDALSAFAALDDMPLDRRKREAWA